MHSTYDEDGSPRVKLKAKPEALLRQDAQLSYVLQLCEPGLKVGQAMGEWVTGKRIDLRLRSKLRA
jgi:hypothetical protein